MKLDVMRSKLIVIIICVIYLPSFGQSIFSEKNFEYRKTLLPYDISYTIPLEDKQFVMLREERKNQMKLGRYDQYFFEQWEKDVEFDEKESVPQIFVKGDSIVTYSFTTDRDKKTVKISFRYFNLSSGEEKDQGNYSFSSISNEIHRPGIAFSEDHSKFVVYNITELGNEFNYMIYQLGDIEPFKVNKLTVDRLSGSSLSEVHLSENGDLLLASVDANSFKTETFFWSVKNDDVGHVASNFFLERPADAIGNIDIIRQGPSSYFISFSANIEDELIGYSTLGINVILKNVLFSYNQSFTQEEINEVYAQYYVTGEKQKKKLLQAPETLKDFRQTISFKNANNDIMLIFEELEIPVEFLETKTEKNMTWKHKSDEDKFYFGGDILLYCFSESGQMKWKKAIQKSQYSQASSLGLSFIPRMKGNQLDLIGFESSKGGNFYILSINTIDGSLSDKINLLPEAKFEFAKRYSCWLDENSVILFGIAPANVNKRTLMLVEY
jgi:hypothetical protein